jgi:hypothetical protein
MSGLNKELLYRELCEEYRTVLRLFWQIPSVVIAIVTLLISAIYYLKPIEAYDIGRAPFMGLASLLLFVAFLAGRKHRVAGRCYIHELRKLEKGIVNIPRSTLQFRDYIRGWSKDKDDKPPKWGRLEERRAQKSLLMIVALMSTGCAILAIYEFITNWFSIALDTGLFKQIAGLVMAIIGIITYFRID